MSSGLEPTLEKRIEILINEVWLRDTEIKRLDEEVANLRDEIERLREALLDIHAICNNWPLIFASRVKQHARAALEETMDD